MRFAEQMREQTTKTYTENGAAARNTSGYQLPNVVFWNVNSRHDLFHVDSKRKGVQLYSGESVMTFRNLLGNIDTIPAEAMEQIIESERYACVRTGNVA